MVAKTPVLDVQLVDHLFVAGVHFVDGHLVHLLVLLVDVLFQELLICVGFHFEEVRYFVCRYDEVGVFFYVLYFLF